MPHVLLFGPHSRITDLEPNEINFTTHTWEEGLGL